MVGNDLLKHDNDATAHLSLLRQHHTIARDDTCHDIDTSAVPLQDVEACKLVGGVQRVARALHIT